MSLFCPKKKPVNDTFMLLDTTRNQKASHDRVLAEKLFECLCTFGIYARKWRRNEDSYGQLFFVQVLH